MLIWQDGSKFLTFYDMEYKIYLNGFTKNATNNI